MPWCRVLAGGARSPAEEQDLPDDEDDDLADVGEGADANLRRLHPVLEAIADMQR